jgi:hypothetical protein
LIKRVISLGAALVALVVVPASQVQAAAEAAKGPFAGTWNCVQKAANYPDRHFVLTLEQKGNELTGTAAAEAGEAPLTGKVDGDSFTFDIDAGGDSYKGTGKLEGGALKGTWTHTSSGAQGTWEGTRK